MSAPTTSRATATRKRAPKPPPEPVTVQALCDTCYDVHPLRLTTTSDIADVNRRDGRLYGACPVCQVERTCHVLIRDQGDPHRDEVEREAESERIAQDAELTWHITELQRLGVRVEYAANDRFAAGLNRWLDDGQFVLTLDWGDLTHAERLSLLRNVREYVDNPDGLHKWCVLPVDEDGPALATVGWLKVDAR